MTDEKDRKIRWLEAFYAVQGEGYYTGRPSVFLRTFGCNFQCRGFGMAPGKLTDEWQAINIVGTKRLEDLPLVDTGCDSYPAWDPRAKHLTKFSPAWSLANDLLALTPKGNFWNIHLILTGGEPLLGWQRAYPQLLDPLKDHMLTDVTFETNGTQPLRDEFCQWLEKEDQIEVLFSISAKLSASGEKWRDAIKPIVIQQYARYGKISFKFVVSSLAHVQEAEKALEEYFPDGNGDYSVFLMPVGGTLPTYLENAPRVAEFALARGWGFSPRLQVQITGNEWGT